MFKVLVADHVDEILISELSLHKLQVDYRPGISYEELLKVIPDYHVIIVRGRTKVTREVIDRGKNLKIIARAGVGLDNIDVEYAMSKGIKVINTAEAPTQSVAELTIGLMIAAARMITLHNEHVKRGVWSKGMFHGIELYGKNIGIVGLGRIGSRVAEIARAIGMNVLAYDVVDVSERARRIGVKLVGDLYELLGQSDVISLHVPLTKETYHMIGRKEFDAMKDGVIFVNTSRGEVVDTRELLNALNRNKVLAAALDVLEHEPPREPWELELLRHPRVIVTPHIGGSTYEAQRRIARLLVEKLIKAVSEIHP